MPAPISARVESLAGRPTLLINEVAYAPLIYALSDCPGARNSWEEVPQRNITEFYRQGVRLFQLDVWLNQILAADGSIDITYAERQIHGVTAVAPDGAVMLRLHLNPTTEWCETHPDECVGYADTTPIDPPRHGLMRPLADDGARPLRASFYSKVWQDWAHTTLTEFCEKLSATPAGNSLFGIQLAYGVYGEWHQFGFIHHDPDTGAAAMKAYRTWLQKKYQDEATLAEAWQTPGLTWSNITAPTSEEREIAKIGVLRDPNAQRAVIDYFTFLHEDLTPVILGFGKTAKATWPRPLVTAAFFGYFYSVFGRQGAGAQLSVFPALNSLHLDCWCSPQSYEPDARDFGGPGNARGIVGVVRRAGKLWLDEMDHPTSNGSCPWDADFSSTLAEDIAMHRRNVLQSVTRGGGQWWYDFGPTARTPKFERYGNVGWWDTPEILPEIEAIHRIVQDRMATPFARPADILLVHDPMSFCHTVSQRHAPAEFGSLPRQAVDPITPLLVDDLLHGLYGSGLCFDEALLDELPELDLSPYRLVLLSTTPVMRREHRKAVHQRIAHEGRHVVLLGYAAWSDDEVAGPELSSALSGIATRLHRPAQLKHQLQLGDAIETRALEGTVEVPAYDVAETDVVGRWADGQTSAARRTTEQATWWTFALPPTSPTFLRQLALTAGCHAINSHAETTLIGNGLIIPHTIEGGPRRLQWPGGPVIETELLPRSTTVFDGVTGERLLG